MTTVIDSNFPFIIAEAGVNHNGDLERARQLIQAARDAGADCVKFQAFSADELVVPDAPKAEYQKKSGPAAENQYDMLKKLELSLQDFAQLKHTADQVGIELLATPFSPAWVQRLLNLPVNALKIGSGDSVSPDLLNACAYSGLPLIVSTGMSDPAEIQNTIDLLQKNTSAAIYPLHCVSAYPTPLNRANLNAIQTLRQSTGLPCGFSDHTTETITGALAVAAGAVILEKHFTLDPALPGPDHALSLTPDQLNTYIQLARQAAAALGNGSLQPQPAELTVKAAARKSIVAAAPIPAGTIITPSMLTLKRPGTGLTPNQLQQLIGKTAARDIQPNTLITMDMIVY